MQHLADTYPPGGLPQQPPTNVLAMHRPVDKDQPPQTLHPPPPTLTPSTPLHLLCQPPQVRVRILSRGCLGRCRTVDLTRPDGDYKSALATARKATNGRTAIRHRPTPTLSRCGPRTRVRKKSIVFDADHCGLAIAAISCAWSGLTRSSKYVVITSRVPWQRICMCATNIKHPQYTLSTSGSPGVCHLLFPSDSAA